MIKYIFFIISIALFIFSCNRESKVQKKFVDRVFIIDSIRAELNDSIIYTGHNFKYILKPKADSTFGLYKDQFVRFEKYFFKGDTLILQKINSAASSYKIYETAWGLHLVNYDKYSFEKEIFLTDITKPFNGVTDFEGSNLYQKLKDNTWYPIKFTFLDVSSSKLETIFDVQKPDYYIYERTLHINGGINDSINSQIPFLIWDNPSKITFKFTNNSIYVFDTEDKTHLYTLKADFRNEDGVEKLHFVGWGTLPIFTLDLMRIDETLLVKEKNLPKKLRLGCNSFIAKNGLSEWLEEISDYDFYYDLKTLNLIREDDENCVYTFKVVWRSKQFYDIASIYRFEVEFLEDGRIKYQQIKN